MSRIGYVRKRKKKLTNELGSQMGQSFFYNLKGVQIAPAT